jgi:hypothetical protein
MAERKVLNDILSAGKNKDVIKKRRSIRKRRRRKRKFKNYKKSAE